MQDAGSTSGAKTVTPTTSTTYHLIAKGAGGSADASVRVTVSAPPAAAAPVNTMSAEEEFKTNVQNIFFDYDKRGVKAGTSSSGCAYPAI